MMGLYPSHGLLDGKQNIKGYVTVYVRLFICENYMCLSIPG